MNTKKIYLSALLISLASLTGCQKKVIYVTPQITGQVIDKQTNKPIEGVKTIINRQALDFTDKQGQFTVPFTTVEYTVSEPNYRKTMSRGNSSFMIYKSGYEIKSYRNGGLSFTSSADGQKRYVNMGQVYLEPVPVGKEGKHETHYSTLDYCKPTQSQKEVDCMPVPRGKTYKQMSPNQPIK